MTTALQRVLAEYERAIRDGMARTLWVSAYADWVESGENVPEGVERAGGGQNWEDHSPDTPDAAEKAADDLMVLYKTAEGGSIVDLFALAMEVEDGEPYEFEGGGEIVHVTRTKDGLAWGHLDRYCATRPSEVCCGPEKLVPKIRGAKRGDLVETKIDDMPEEFGSDLAMMALGTGISWFDDHKEKNKKTGLKVVIPQVNFECRFDGDQLTWSGGNESTGLGLRAPNLGRIVDINPETHSYRFSHRYVLAFGAYGETLLLVRAEGIEDALSEAIDWLVDNEPGYIIDDQVNEEYARAIAEGLSEEKAMERAEQDTISGGNAGNHISSAEWTIVAEDPTDDQLEELGAR